MKELLLFGGISANVAVPDIWRFSSKTNLWTKVGEMQFAASEHAIALVKGIRCFNWKSFESIESVGFSNSINEFKSNAY